MLLAALVEVRQTMRQPFLGVFTEPTLVINGLGDRTWSGYAAGLDFPQRIVALDGRPLEAPTALSSALAEYRVGDVVTLTVQDPLRGTERSVRVRLTDLPGDAFLEFFLLPHVLAWLYLATGLWALWTERRGEAGPVFAAASAGAVIVIGLLFDVFTTHRFWWIWVAATPLAGSAILHLALVFPQRIRPLAGVSWPIWLLYLPGVVLAVIGVIVTADWEHPTAYFDPWFWGRLWAGLGVVCFGGMLLYHRIFSPSPIVRVQARTVLWGAILGFSPYLTWNLVSRGATFPFDPLFVLPWMVLFPLSIAYSIRRYRTLDIGWVLRRAVVYSLLAMLLVVVYLFLALLFNRLFGLRVSLEHPLLLLFFVFVVAVGLAPAQTFLQRWADRLLGGRGFAREQALQGFIQSVARVSTERDVLDALAHALQRAISPQWAALYLLDTRLGQYVPRPLVGDPPQSRFGRESPLASRVMEARQPLYLRPDERLPQDLAEDLREVLGLGAALFLPIPERGWLVVGPPPLGRRFRTDDLRFLEDLVVQLSSALDRVRLVSDLQQRVTELETLRLIAQSVGYSVELDDLLELIYTQTGRVLDATNFYIALYDPGKRTLRFAFYVEEGERRYPDDVWPDTEGLTGVIVRTGRPIVTNDYLSECERRGVRPGGKPGRAWMGMPLISRSQILGVINVSSFDPDVAYTDEQAQVFRAIADQAAAILDKARLYREMQKRARQLEALNEIGGVITSTLELDEVLDLVMDKAIELLQAEAGSLLLVDEETGDLVFRVVAGPRTANLVGARLPVGTGIVGQVAETARPLIVDDVQRDERWYPGVDAKTDFVTRSILCVPLIARGRVIGVIELLNRRDGNPFGEEDQQLLTAFAAQAAVAIENARLFTMTDQALAARVEELSMMQRIDRELNATLDYRRVMEIALDWALRTTEADIGLVAVVVEKEDGQRGLRFLANRGYPEDLVAAHAESLWPMEQGIIGRTVQGGEPILVEDVQNDPDYFPAVPGMVAQLTVPIRREERIVGVMVLESSRKGCLDQEALEFTTRLADHAAIALENARLFEAVRAANQAKTEFISFVSHELQQPMTAIKGYADLLVKGTAGEITEAQQSFLEVIRSNVERMRALVSDLLDVSRIESGRIRLEIGPVAMHEAVEEAVRGVREQVMAKNQDLQVEVPETLPLVSADRDRLVQVLTNLLSNAYKYTPQGGSIRVLAETTDGPDGRFVRCSVSDTGIGISPEDQKRLFTKYFRAQDDAVRQVPGTGLGLVITKSLVELQGGEIWVESMPGEGSTFTFTVPVAAG